MKTFPVYVGRCREYNPEAIAAVVRSGLRAIGFSKSVSGKIVIKPNLVMAHPKVATESYTRPEVVEAVVQVMRERGKGIEKIDIVEKSGLGVSTASMFRWAGYRSLRRRYGVRLVAMEEARQSTVVLRRGRIHHHVAVAGEMAERDFLVFVPKLKTNVLSHAYSGALKLNIGTVDSKERLFHHNMDLPLKIADLLEAANPDLIVTDGIRMAFGGNQMTQGGTDIGVIVVSTNAVAHDMACARMLNLDPMRIDHIREAAERGYGPSSFKQVRILGDVPVKSVQALTRKLDFGYYPVGRFKSPFRIVSGSPYCTGGCHGIFLDWLHMVKDRKPGLIKRFPALTVLIGRVEEDIRSGRILLIGDCAKASPGISGKKTVRIAGCPPTHKRIVLAMMLRYGLLAPLVRPSLIIDGFVLYPLKKLKGLLVNLGR
ncbi:DUF362 domain-containing protein [bacterium]|nr:DUF362 domain-containing protein [bacterium]